MKLLYYLDFDHFKQTGKSVTNLQYYAWDWGPVPKDFFYEMENSDNKEVREFFDIVPSGNFKEVVGRKEFDSKFFSKREIGLLEKWAFILKDAKADEISEASHFKNHPWDITCKEKGEHAPIDYMLILDDTLESVSKEDAERRELERQNVYNALGTI